MRVCKPLLLTLSIAMALAVNKKAEFKVTEEDLARHPQKVTAEQVSLAATAYVDADRAKPLFGGRANPYDNGILPVLLMIKNEGTETISLQSLLVEFIGATRQKLEAIPPMDVAYIRGASNSRVGSNRIPGGPGIRIKKNVFNAQDFVERSFAVKMLPPGEFAYGFVYFQTGTGHGSKVLIHGLKRAQSGKQLFFFELPLD